MLVHAALLAAQVIDLEKHSSDSIWPFTLHHKYMYKQYRDYDVYNSGMEQSLQYVKCYIPHMQFTSAVYTGT